MQKIKHKLHFSLVALAFVAVVAFTQGLLIGSVSAQEQRVTCPDGFSTLAPFADRNAVCQDHQTGTDQRDSEETGATAPGCYVQGQRVTCPTNQAIDQSKCYTASASSQGISSFREFPCDASTATNFSGDCKTSNPDKSNCGIIAYLVTFINALSAIVGIVIVIMITVGGIQYSTARDNPQAAVAAKTRITNAIMALVFFLFIYAFLQWIVPGGIL